MKRTQRVLVIGLLLVGIGCGQANEFDNNEAAPNGTVEINYRGQKRIAQRYGKLLLVEGDIQVDPGDMWGPEDADSDIVGLSGALKIAGGARRWPGTGAPNPTSATIPFRFGTYNNSATGGTLLGALSAAQQTAITNSMNTWSAMSPGIVFRPRVAADANFITFNLATVCSSRVGRNAGDNELGAGVLAGEQLIHLATGCIGISSTEHEIAHALGIQHEQTRTDQATYVTINWANIQGCLATATGPTPAQGCTGCAGATTAAQAQLCGCTLPQVQNNTCNAAPNFPLDNATSSIGIYDYSSVMHYGATAFTKTGPATITALSPANAPFLGTAADMGQRNHLSSRDTMAMMAMYPSVYTHKLFFNNTGSKNLCIFLGRQDDRFGTRFSLPASTLPGAATPANTGAVNTNGLALGTYNATCTATSTFWDGTYDLPNFTVGFNAGTAVANRDVWNGANGTLKVLNRGLIPIIFTPPG